MRTDFGQKPAAHNWYREMYSVLAALAALDLSAHDIQNRCPNSVGRQAQSVGSDKLCNELIRDVGPVGFELEPFSRRPSREAKS